MYETTALLKAETISLDEYLNEVRTYTSREVFVKPRSVYASDFYEAARSGLQPSVVLVMSNPEDYEGEKVAEYNGKDYTIIRVFQRPDRDEVELTLEERTENGA